MNIMNILSNIDSELIFSVLVVFILKLLDNTFGTIKTIYLAKERYMLASIANCIGTAFYLIALVKLTKESSTAGLVAMCVATFMGTYIPGKTLKLAEKDRLYIFDITADNYEDGKEFADTIRDLNLSIRTMVVHDKNMNKTIACKVYCKTKSESKIVMDILTPEFKWNVYVPITNVKSS